MIKPCIYGGQTKIRYFEKGLPIARRCLSLLYWAFCIPYFGFIHTPVLQYYEHAEEEASRRNEFLLGSYPFAIFHSLESR
mmetsp:Transcript_22722/g.36802  ORF Transcript_22722/g.36802 Transcript_22722/m.36802 type:complete len:80 (-) Transcript_22722:117-356(-)